MTKFKIINNEVTVFILAARMMALSQPRRQKHIGPNMSETYCWLFSTNTEVPKYITEYTLTKYMLKLLTSTFDRV